jgi:hypothetical protein
MNRTVYYLQLFELRNSWYEFSKVCTFSAISAYFEINRKKFRWPVSGQPWSTAVNDDLGRPWLIQWIWSICDPHRCFGEDGDGGFRRTSVAALRRSPRPAVVVARLGGRRRAPWRSPGVPCTPSGGGELLPRSQWWWRGRTSVRNRIAWRRFFKGFWGNRMRRLWCGRAGYAPQE